MSKILVRDSGENKWVKQWKTFKSSKKQVEKDWKSLF